MTEKSHGAKLSHEENPGPVFCQISRPLGNSTTRTTRDFFSPKSDFTNDFLTHPCVTPRTTT
ncbi:hypothetical protein PCASD_08596 [Puccinia coronata f. sp. avenae]|uniref:Uncharacterized protein n=1 Tax=Puccinia coronata f. sp. avenae TaxID=200324 RepID=A0A2N5UBW2_9BASI|nr:hypothetical protein PCASD_08596 [Puccinia coronata f. sp. avenae]